MLVDTDVLIWHLRGYVQAARKLDAIDSLTISAVSYLELLQGMRSKTELAAVKKMLERRAATVLPMSEAITHRAIAIMDFSNLEPWAADGRCAHCGHGARTRVAIAHRERQALHTCRWVNRRSVLALA